MPVRYRRCKVCSRRFRAKTANNTLCSDACKAQNRRDYNRDFAQRDHKQAARFRAWYERNRQKVIDRVEARRRGLSDDERRKVEVLQEFAEAQTRSSGRLSRYGYGLLRAVRRNSPGLALGAWFITPHAVQRYRERVRPLATYEQALMDLVDESEKAHFVRRDGEIEHWRGARPRRLRFRVVWGEGDLPTLLTVLTAHDECTTEPLAGRKVRRKPDPRNHAHQDAKADAA